MGHASDKEIGHKPETLAQSQSLILVQLIQRNRALIFRVGQVLATSRGTFHVNESCLF
jgi:hypothetical protein